MKPDAARQAEVERFIAERGATRCPAAGLPSMTPEDRRALEEHAERLESQRLQRLTIHSAALAKAARLEREKSAERARKAVKQGRGIVEPKPAPDPTRAGWDPKADLRAKAQKPSPAAPAPAPAPKPSQTKPPAAPAEKPQPRPVDLRKSEKPTFDPGPRPTLGWLDVKLLDVDHQYQRPLRPRHAKQLAAAFRWSDFQPITVTDLGNGRYAAIDGQHRLRAALSIPEITDVPCYIIPRSTVQEQARTFLAINGSHQAVLAIDRFRAGLLAGDPAIVEVEAIARSIGLKLVGPGNGGPMATMAIDILLRLRQHCGADALRKGLTAIARAWPKEREAFSATYVSAVVRTFKQGPRLTVDQAALVLGKINPTRFAADMAVKGKEEGKSASSMVFAELHRRMLGREFKR